MKLSAKGIEFIKREEGERLKGYLDSRGVATIGTGHTGTVDNKPVTTEMTLTSEKSTQLLLSDINRVEKAIDRLVTVILNQNEYDALCSLVFNIGIQAFSTSTLLRRLNENNREDAAKAMLMWKRAGNDADILLPRRQREYQLFTLR